MSVIMIEITQAAENVFIGKEMLSAMAQVIVAVGFAAVVVLLSAVCGKRASHRAPADVPYESGIVPVGKGNPMFAVKFYVVAMLFVIFDLEVVFLYPWAVIFKDFVIQNREAFVSASVFIGILLAAYLYALGKGVFKWHENPEPGKNR